MRNGIIALALGALTVGCGSQIREALGPTPQEEIAKLRAENQQCQAERTRLETELQQLRAQQPPPAR